LDSELQTASYQPGTNSDDLREAFRSWVGIENLEHRWSDAAIIDRTELEILFAED